MLLSIDSTRHTIGRDDVERADMVGGQTVRATVERQPAIEQISDGTDRWRGAMHDRQVVLSDRVDDIAPSHAGGESNRARLRVDPGWFPEGAWYRTPSPAEMGAGNHADLSAALHNPAVVHGMCEDYRAGLRIDRAHEEADRVAGRRIACPMLLLAATEDDIDIHGDPEAIWRLWVAGELRSTPIHSGHHQAEEAPEELTEALLEFLAAPM